MFPFALALALSAAPAAKPPTPPVDAGVSAAPVVTSTAKAELKDINGKVLGRAEVKEGKHGLVLMLELEGVPAGSHALHFHAKGKCDPATKFDSAGPHFNPSGAKHGLLSGGMGHAGDLPNVVVPESGKLKTELLVHGVKLKDGAQALLDADGASLMVHAKADDYASDPGGAAGDRMACGELK